MLASAPVAAFFTILMLALAAAMIKDYVNG